MSSCTQVDCVPFLEDGSNKFHIIEPQLSVFYGASLVEAGKCPQETHLFIYLSSMGAFISILDRPTPAFGTY
ncbi:hypothetical protein Peur_018635 [Populus x canadensis]